MKVKVQMTKSIWYYFKL